MARILLTRDPHDCQKELAELDDAAGTLAECSCKQLYRWRDGAWLRWDVSAARRKQLLKIHEELSHGETADRG